jgi:hypothetical protein
VLKFPALSLARDPEHPRSYDLRRAANIPLFPQFKSTSVPAGAQERQHHREWESLYQQSPIVVGGGMFPLDRIKLAVAMPDHGRHQEVCSLLGQGRHDDGGAYTAGVLMHALHSGGWFISRRRSRTVVGVSARVDHQVHGRARHAMFGT